MKGKLLKRALAVAAGLAAVALALELALRWTGYDPRPHPMGPRYLHVRDEKLGVRLAPSFEGRFEHAEFSVRVRTNALGLRDDELGEKAPGTFRVLVLGDSFAFGYGVEQGATFADVLERELADLVKGVEVDVVNAGVSSYGPWHMRVLFEELAGTVEPDLVLATFFFANDLTDPLGPAFTERGGVVMGPEEAAFVDAQPVLRFGMEHSDLVTFVRYSWLAYRYGLAPPPRTSAADLSDERKVYSAPGVELLAREPTDDTRELWRRAGESLSRLCAAVRERNLPLVLVNVPLEYQVDPTVWERTQAICGLAPQRYDLRKPARWLAALCEREGVSSLVLAPELAEAPGPLYYPVNMHWNAAGHAAAGRLAARFLAEQGLVPK